MKPDAADKPGMPGWVKIFGIVAAVLAVLLAVMLLTGHGPGGHMHGGLGQRAHTPVAAP